MPSAGPDQKRRDLSVQPVFFALRTRVLDCTAHRIAEIHLTLDHVLPRRRVRIFEIGHERLSAGVQCVDHHLAVRRPGDFNTPVDQVGGDGSDGPGVLSDPRVLLREVERLAAIDPRLAFHSPAQQVQAGGIESSMEVGDEIQRFRREDLGARALDR